MRRLRCDGNRRRRLNDGGIDENEIDRRAFAFEINAIVQVPQQELGIASPASDYRMLAEFSSLQIAFLLPGAAKLRVTQLDAVLDVLPHALRLLAESPTAH